ncbi:MAG: rhodanese-like domain-containing protein [Syntrophomonadaceae bacterium]|nr:rhodanese-like domain-containing protein [Syntrophomonadaceae bacterium]
MLKRTKLLSLFLSLLIVFSLVTGCGTPDTNTEVPVQGNVQTGTETQDVAQDTHVLAWDDWSAKMQGTINQDYYVVDLRTPDEIKLEKFLEGSINIDANTTLATGNTDVIDEKLAAIAKDELILIHCKSGMRAKKNLQIFIDKGYLNTFALDAWTAFDSKSYFSGAKIDANTEQVKPDAWLDKMQGTLGKDYYIIDARDKSEYDAGHIAGALNYGVRDQFTIDHPETIAKVKEAIPNQNDLILLHCAVGTRGKVAQAHLKAEGYTNVILLDNKITIDAKGNYEFE